MRTSTRLTGNLPRWAKTASDAGTVPGATPMHITVMLSRAAEQEAAFTQLLVDQQNPSSPMYHRWLTPTQIGEQFGPSANDVAAVTGWLTGQGLDVVSVAPSRIFVEVTGTTATVGAALSTSFHRVLLDGTQRVSATAEPTIPLALASVVSGINGLTELPLKHFSSVQAATPQAAGNLVRPMYSDSTNTVHYVLPGDFAKIYDITTLSGGVYAGTGVKVAIIGQSRVAASDITLLETLAGLPSATANVVIPAGSTDPGMTQTDDQDEATLDVARVLTTAPGVQADLIVATPMLTGGGITAAMQYNVQTLIDPIMTISYGVCEASAGTANIVYFDTLFQQGAAEGISTFVSSGDSGAAGCDAKASSPTGMEVRGINAYCASSYATCVGGTQLNDTANPALYWSPTNSSTYTSALSYIPEGAWNEPTGLNSAGATVVQINGTGGGSSILTPKPTWQTGTGVPSDGARDVPDVSFLAAHHDPYYGCLAYKGAAFDCSSGGGTLFAGTSASAPNMAAVTAMLVQKTGTPLGDVNPTLYALAATTPAAFHDATPATSGVVSCTLATASPCNNSTPGVSGPTGGLAGYALQVGYDEATGLGSLDVTNFVNAAAGAAVLASTTTLTAQPTTIVAGKTAVFTATVAVAGTATISGTVQFYSNGVSLGSPVTVAGGTASTPATPFATAGTYAITAMYSGNTTYASSTSAALSFVVTALPTTTTTVTASPTTIVAGKTATFTASLAITSTTAATGTVQFFSNGNALGAPVTVTGGTASFTSTFTTPGTYAITASYSGDTANAPSTSPALSFVVTALPTTTTTVTASPTTIVAGKTATFTASLAITSTTAATGTVQFFSNGNALGAPVTVTSGMASVTSTFTTPGTYAITAIYSGDTANAPSTSAAISFVVTALPATTTIVTASPTTIVAGNAATFTANVATTSTTAPSGTVQFFSNGTALGAPVAISGGTASFPSTFNVPGTYAITASYSGDTSNASSTSSSLSFVVTVAAPMGLAVSAAPATLTLSAGATTGNTSAVSVATTGAYYGNVALTCAVSYSGGTSTYPPTCSFAPSSLAFAGSVSGSSVLTIATTLPHATAGFGQAAKNAPLYAPLGGMSFAALLLVLVPSRRRKKLGLLAVLLGAGMAAMTGCGSSGGTVPVATPVGTTQGSYSVTVTAAPSAGSAVTTVVKLTVQ